MKILGSDSNKMEEHCKYSDSNRKEGACNMTLFYICMRTVVDSLIQMCNFWLRNFSNTKDTGLD